MMPVPWIAVAERRPVPEIGRRKNGAGMPSYFARYAFKNDRLAWFRFGFSTLTCLAPTSVCVICR